MFSKIIPSLELDITDLLLDSKFLDTGDSGAVLHVGTKAGSFGSRWRGWPS